MEEEPHLFRHESRCRVPEQRDVQHVERLGLLRRLAAAVRSEHLQSMVKAFDGQVELLRGVQSVATLLASLAELQNLHTHRLFVAAERQH